MDRYRIVGDKCLEGEVSISGSKNSSLPIMAASLLTQEEVILNNVPQLNDVFTMKKLLQELGKIVTFENNRMVIQQGKKISCKASYDTVKTMRASIAVLGPLLARYQEAYVSSPGGCSIGNRPVDLHIQAMESLGAEVYLDAGYIIAKAPQLIGTKIRLVGANGVTVLGTANALMASVLAKGETVIDPAAREPEIQDLAYLLIKMGAKIKGIGTSILTITGVSELKGVEHTIIPDRIEVGTFISMAGATKGNLLIKNVDMSHLKEPLKIAEAIGLTIRKQSKNSFRVLTQQKLIATDIVTMPYPDFPTDMQPQYMVLLIQAEGRSSIQELVFEDRLHHIAELSRMGAKLKEIKSNMVLIEGVVSLQGAPVMASDLRAGAALVIAALAAKGESVIERIYHIDRGYENFEQKITQLGGNIKREKS